MYSGKLKYIINSVLGADFPQDFINASDALLAYFNELIDTGEYLSNDNEVTVKGGIALSGFHAADCINDCFRTVSFIKGVYNAIKKLQSDFPEKEINIMYAGTGPFATLVLPLLALFKPSEVSVLFLDINQSSIDSVKFLINKIGLQKHDLKFAVGDATTYKIPVGLSVDLLVSETMHLALTQEPQVSIAKNLIPQLPLHAQIIPQAIHIDFGYSFFAKEPFASTSDDIRKGYNKLQPYEHRIIIDRLFTINKELFSNQSNSASRFTSKFYTLPVAFDNQPDACIFTEITVFDDIKLTTAQSLITNPYCLVSLYTIQQYSAIQLVYDFSDIPNWTYSIT